MGDDDTDINLLQQLHELEVTHWVAQEEPLWLLGDPNGAL